ncbi:hypothetical protein FPOA_05217 [Fusarium poae]|uniref:Extracellular membrane protein CFEM domain-containing protein n=1 Tax=Fusarium poae TaxID=36050 RepID=A0A1B8AW18_FUSPO|nr:hypothetical protein FPOA_05217 [Fusarium poae]
MKVSVQFVTVALAASAAAHPQNGRKGPPSSTTSGSATSSTAVPSKGSMYNLPFMPTWFFRDSSQNKCIGAYNACLIAKSSDQSSCASDYASCIKTAASSGAPSGVSATSTKPPPSATGSTTASRTTGRPQLPTSLRQWWGQEQGRRRCRYEHYTCIRDKSNDKADCDDKRASCFASIKTVTATTGPTSIPTRSAATATTTTGTSSAAVTSSTTVVDAGAAPTATDAPLNADDPSFDDDSDDST